MIGNYIKAGGSSKIGNYIKAVASGPALDPDAAAFLTAASITDPTITSAINTLVLDMKGYGIWTKMKAIYPFVGGTATTHKWNLKDAQDTNAAFRLVFNGGITHSSTGILGNGTNGYANTYLATNQMSLNSGHVSFYSRTNNTNAVTEIGGGNSSPDSYTAMQLRGPNLPLNTFFWYNNSATVDSVTGVNTAAFFCGTRTASNIIKLFRNSSIIINGTAPSNATSIHPQYILAYNNASSTPLWYSNRECAFASIGDGLTDTEAADFYTAVQNFNTTLSRNV